MHVMGICDGHDAGACLMRDGRVLAAVSEERLSRRKRQPGFPGRAVRSCLEMAGVRPARVDRVAVAERTGRAPYRLLDGIYAATDPNQPMHRLANRISMALQNRLAVDRDLARLDAAVSRRSLSRRLAALGIEAPLAFVDHHLAHALAAARGSGFPEALVVTQDAYGDGRSGVVARWQEGGLEELCGVPYPNSPALLYGLVTSYLGYAEGEEGQVAGLAAHGNPERTRERFRHRLVHDGGRLLLDRLPSRRTVRGWLRSCTPADVAAGLQAVVEEVMGAFVGHWVERTRSERLCLAGGLFANVRLNQVVAEAASARDLYVFPHMGDGGLCVGAAWAHAWEGPAGERMPVFVGPDAGSVAGREESGEGIHAGPLGDAGLETVASRLAAGEPVGLFTGRMEFGPRALGNRSILLSAREPDLAGRIGRALDRPGTMPFAPVARACDLDRFTRSPAWSALREMTVTVDALPGVAERFPTAVHVDGTMRLQTAVAEAHPVLHGILCAYARHEDPPLLINTSFNRHGEPIVDEAGRAFELFRTLPLGALVAGDRIFFGPA